MDMRFCCDKNDEGDLLAGALIGLALGAAVLGVLMIAMTILFRLPWRLTDASASADVAIQSVTSKNVGITACGNPPDAERRLECLVEDVSWIGPVAAVGLPDDFSITNTPDVICWRSLGAGERAFDLGVECWLGSGPDDGSGQQLLAAYWFEQTSDEGSYGVPVVDANLIDGIAPEPIDAVLISTAALRQCWEWNNATGEWSARPDPSLVVTVTPLPPSCPVGTEDAPAYLGRQAWTCHIRAGSRIGSTVVTTESDFPCRSLSTRWDPITSSFQPLSSSLVGVGDCVDDVGNTRQSLKLTFPIILEKALLQDVGTPAVPGVTPTPEPSEWLCNIVDDNKRMSGVSRDWSVASVTVTWCEVVEDLFYTSAERDRAYGDRDLMCAMKSVTAPLRWGG